jgi:hypothetical protein
MVRPQSVTSETGGKLRVETDHGEILLGGDHAPARTAWRVDEKGWLNEPTEGPYVAVAFSGKGITTML